MQSPQVEKL